MDTELLLNACSCPMSINVILNVDRLFSVFSETKFQVQIFMFSKYHRKPHSHSVVDVGEGFFSPRQVNYVHTILLHAYLKFPLT